MIKNIFVIFTMIIMLSLFGVCNQNSLKNDMPLSDTASESGTINIEDDAAKKNIVTQKRDKYMLKSELFEQIKDDIDIKIRYPQITKDEAIMIKRSNSLIKEAAINKYYEQWNLKGLTLDQSYIVENQGDELLSIVFYGYAYVTGTAYPTDTCHAVTVNLKTAEKYNLSDFIESYEYLENRIIDGKCEILYGGLKGLTLDELSSIVHTNFESVSIEQNTQKFYTTQDGKICIIIDMPNAGGDYSILCF